MCTAPRARGLQAGVRGPGKGGPRCRKAPSCPPAVSGAVSRVLLSWSFTCHASTGAHFLCWETPPGVPGQLEAGSPSPRLGCRQPAHLLPSLRRGVASRPEGKAGDDWPERDGGWLQVSAPRGPEVSEPGQGCVWGLEPQCPEGDTGREGALLPECGQQCRGTPTSLETLKPPGSWELCRLKPGVRLVGPASRSNAAHVSGARGPRSTPRPLRRPDTRPLRRPPPCRPWP